MTLEAIAQRTAGDPVLGPFAEYCRLKGLGLRREALLALNKLIADLNANPDVTSRFEVVDRLFEIENEADIHSLLPHPLVTKVMWPTCEARILQNDRDSRPYRWLGFQDNWRKALELDPDDAIARGRWSSACWRDLDYAFHELPAGVLSSVDEIAQSVATLDQLARGPGGPANWPGSWLRRLAVSYLDHARSGERVSLREWAASYDRPLSANE